MIVVEDHYARIGALVTLSSEALAGSGFDIIKMAVNMSRNQVPVNNY